MGYESPMILNIQALSKGDLKVFIAFKNLEPTSTNCEKQYVNVIFGEG
jgi:hypothetical protein